MQATRARLLRRLGETNASNEELAVLVGFLERLETCYEGRGWDLSADGDVLTITPEDPITPKSRLKELQAAAVADTATAG